jgi:hypothetical protein
MTDNRIRLSLYLPKQKHKELKIFCAELGISMNCFIDNAIKDKIEKELKKGKEK